MEIGLLENVLNNSQLAMAIIDRNGDITWGSEHFHSLIKYKVKISSNLADVDIDGLFFVTSNQQQLKQALLVKHCQTIFYKSMKLNGLGLAIQLGRLTSEHRIVVFSRQYDIPKVYSELETDSLTGLLNRSVFEKFLKTSKGVNGKLGFSIMLIDLDRFKRINDTLGHPIGDKLLKLVANRFQKLLRPDDTFIRIGGDEFALIISDKIEEDALLSLAKRIITSACKTFILQSHQIDIGASVGIAIVNSSYSNFSELYRHADLALYASKSHGGSRASVFTTDLEVRSQYRRSLETGLRRGLLKNEFRIVYQSQIDVSSKRMLGLDAMLEWHSEELGKVDAKNFYPIAENIGEMNKIGYWAFEQAFKETMGLLNPYILSFIVTVGQLSDADFVTRMNQLLINYKIKPSIVELIIPEKAFLEVLARDTIKTLSSLGILISLNDPNTGYESLRFLKRLPISRMRVNREYTNLNDLKVNSLEMIKPISDIGEMLGIPVVAKDINTENELLKLKNRGDINISGFYSSPALSVEQLKISLKSKVAL
jgi:diguanylate cyclase (GGDEF)-like protein